MATAQGAAADPVAGRSSSSTRSIASTRRSRTAFLRRASKPATSCSSVHHGKPFVRGERRRCCRARRSSCCSRATHDAIVQIVRRALTDRERGLGGADIVVRRRGPSRRSPNSPTAMRGTALNLLEFAAASAPMDPETCVRQLGMAQLDQSIQRRALLYDKGGEEHYNLISALHKSMRNSDPDAAVYGWRGC